MIDRKIWENIDHKISLYFDEGEKNAILSFTFYPVSYNYSHTWNNPLEMESNRYKNLSC